MNLSPLLPFKIITLISENSKCTRLSAIGFGQGASTALVSGAARAGNGRALFVRDGYVVYELFFNLSV